MTPEIVWRDLNRLVFEVADPHRAVVEATGMSFFRSKVLRRLLNGPLSAADLVERLGSDAPYVSVTLRDLESRGYVERNEDPTDRRRRLVALTGSGRAVADLAEATLGKPPPALAGLDDADLTELARILSSMVD